MQGKVLLLSQRRLSRLVAQCLGYEFEDVFAAVTDADYFETNDFAAIETSRRAYKLARLVTSSPALARRFAPYPRGSFLLKQDYELFFPVFSHLYELYALEMIPDWRKRSRKAACFITEAWSDMLPEYLIELLRGFDHIFLGCRHSVKDIARITGRPCTYLPIAADVERFAPSTPDQQRPIDVSYIGRRSDATHRALLDRAGRGNFFYYYDTVAASGGDQKNRTFQVDDPIEHRRLLSSLLKRSRYFIANRSFVNRPEYIEGRDEISPRFYEGAAAGAVMLGEPPRIPEFKEQFDWPDAIIHLPFDSPDIAGILADLDANVARTTLVRRNNVRNAALRHDWLYRIRAVFDTLGLPHTEKMQARARTLEQIATRAEAA